MHTRCFKEMLHIAKALLARKCQRHWTWLRSSGFTCRFIRTTKVSLLIPVRSLRWRHSKASQSFSRCRSHRANLTAYSNLLSSNVSKKCAQLKVKNKLCKKIQACKDNCHAYCLKRELVSRDAQCCSYGGNDDQCHYIICNCDHDNER
jgi:hypothetical protein